MLFYALSKNLFLTILFWKFYSFSFYIWIWDPFSVNFCVCPSLTGDESLPGAVVYAPPQPQPVPRTPPPRTSPCSPCSAPRLLRGHLLLEADNSFSGVAASICIPASNESSAAPASGVLGVSHANGCVVISHCCFDLSFLNGKWH